VVSKKGTAVWTFPLGPGQSSQGGRVRERDSCKDEREREREASEERERERDF